MEFCGWSSLLALVGACRMLFRNKVQFDWAMFWQQLAPCERGAYCCGDCADLCDVLVAGGAVGGVCVADEEGFGGVAAGVAVYWVYGGGVVWAAGGFDAAVPGGAAGGAVAEFAGGGVHDRADVRSGRGGGDLFVLRWRLRRRTLPHHEVFVRAGVLSLGATLAIAVFAGVVRVAGGAVAGFARADGGAAVEVGWRRALRRRSLGFAMG